MCSIKLSSLLIFNFSSLTYLCSICKLRIIDSAERTTAIRTVIFLRCFLWFNACTWVRGVVLLSGLSMLLNCSKLEGLDLPFHFFHLSGFLNILLLVLSVFLNHLLLMLSHLFRPLWVSSLRVSWRFTFWRFTFKRHCLWASWLFFRLFFRRSFWLSIGRILEGFHWITALRRSNLYCLDAILFWKLLFSYVWLLNQVLNISLWNRLMWLCFKCH